MLILEPVRQFNIHHFTHFDLQVYATVKQSAHSRDVTICGGSERIRHVLLSDAGSVEIHVTAFGTQVEKPYFLIKYEGKRLCVFCKPKIAPEGGAVVNVVCE